MMNPENMLFIDLDTSELAKSYKFSDITHYLDSEEEIFVIKTKDGNKHIL